MLLRSRLVPLSQFTAEWGHCWIAPLPPDAPEGDRSEAPFASRLRVFENEAEIAPGHAQHDMIRQVGAGHFSHWGRHLYFSTSDNSSPLTNGRRYTALIGDSATTPQQNLLAEAAGVDIATLDPFQRYAWGERLFYLFVADTKLSEHGRSFFLERDFVEDYARFNPDNYRSLDRKFLVKELLKHALRAPGDTAECGVYRGATAYIIAKAIIRGHSRSRLHLFDSFAGLSTPRSQDGGYWTAGDLTCSLKDVAKNLDAVAHVVEFHPGWIPSRFDVVADLRFSFVHIDVDLHQPTRDSIAFFYPRLSSGGILICDDYGFETCPGARRAMDEFFADKSEPILHLPTGQGIVIRDAR